MEDLRQLLKTVYKAGMILVTAVLVVGAAAAWWYSTPANQLLLIAGILAILALITGLSINKLEWQDQRAEALRSFAADVRSAVTVNYSFAEPEVHRVDESLLAEARDMRRRGEPIDAICQRIDPAFNDHDDMHREAIRRMVQAMLESGEGYGQLPR